MTDEVELDFDGHRRAESGREERSRRPVAGSPPFQGVDLSSNGIREVVGEESKTVSCNCTRFFPFYLSL